MLSFDVKVEIPRFGGYAPDARSGSASASCSGTPSSVACRRQVTAPPVPSRGYSEHPFLLAASNEGRLKPIVLPNTSRGSNKVKKFRATSFENTSGIPYVFYAGGYVSTRGRQVRNPICSS